MASGSSAADSRLGLAADVGRLEKDDGVALVERVAFPRPRLAHDPAARRGDQVLHLHRFEDGDLLARADAIAVRNIDRDDRPLQRRRDRHGPFRTLKGGRAGVAGVGLGRLEVKPAMRLRRLFQKLGAMRLDEARVDPAGDEIGMGDQRLQEGQVGVDPDDAELGERARQLCRGDGEIGRRRMRDNLGDQRVERRAGAIAGIAERIDPDAGAGGQVERRDPAGARDGLAGRRHRLQIDARLKRVSASGARAVEAQLGQRRSGRDLNLRLDEIDVECFLGDGVLDLQAGIGLDEGEPGVVRRIGGVDEELERAEAVVSRLARDPSRRADDPLAQARRQRRAGRDLDQLLVAALDRAFALAEVDEAAVPVAKDLDLDVARAGDQALGVERTVAEGARRLRPAAGEGLGDLGLAAHGAHAASAAARDRLEHDRRADARRRTPAPPRRRRPSRPR